MEKMFRIFSPYIHDTNLLGCLPKVPHCRLVWRLLVSGEAVEVKENIILSSLLSPFMI